MRRIYFVICALVFVVATTQAQNKQSAPSSPSAPQRSNPQIQPSTPQQRPPQVFDLSEVGVQILPDPRLIVMMAALDAAGFDPTPAGEDPSVFRAQVRKGQANLDPDLKRRMAAFFERNKLREEDPRDHKLKDLPPAQQAARYVSLAYALGNAPGFEEPARSDDLPGGILDVLDFAPLVREFYRKSAIDERMPEYTRMYQAEGERLRRPTIQMVRSVLSYLNTRPITSTIERIAVTAPTTDKKKNVPMKYESREHVRRFRIVPDLLAAPGSTNFRVIADDYFVTVPYCDETRYYCPGRDNNPVSPELRRAYIQYVVDPLVIRFAHEILARKDQLKQLLDARTAAGADVSPDMILTVARSLTAATDARLEETTRLDAMTLVARNQLAKATSDAQRTEITEKLKSARAELEDEVTAELAESYESGAVLDFYFAEQLRGVESSGFDIGNSLSDMISSFDPAREAKRLAEADAARRRAAAARKARASQADNSAAIAALPNAALVKQLLDVDEMVQLKNYAGAEERLLALLRESPNEPRIYFALGETASLSAVGTTDEDLRDQRLNKALTNYRNAVRVSTPDTDHCLLARAHEAMGRILDFQDQKDEALKEFDAAIQLGDTSCDAYAKAVAGKKKLLHPQ